MIRIAYFLLGLVIGCGTYNITSKPGPQGDRGRDAGDCNVGETGIVSCPDGSTYQIPAGEAGPSGTSGPEGPSGDAGRPGRDGDRGASGPQGERGTDGAAGTPGAVGRDGVDGNVGPVGSTGPAGSQGPAGEPGADGRDAILEILDPCGDDPGRVDEVLLRFGDGRLLAWYFGVGLFEITEGNWQTTDASHCNFTVHEDGTVTW